jgi:hypothetical protein
MFLHFGSVLRLKFGIVWQDSDGMALEVVIAELVYHHLEGLSIVNLYDSSFEGFFRVNSPLRCVNDVEACGLLDHHSNAC